MLTNSYIFYDSMCEVNKHVTCTSVKHVYKLGEELAGMGR